MSDSFSILIYPKLSNKYRKGKASLFLRITVDGRRSELSLKRKIEPGTWNSFSAKVKGSRPQVKEFNRFLDEVQSRILKIQGEYVKLGEYYTANMLRNDFMGKDKNRRTLLKLYQEHNDEIFELVGREYSVGGIKGMYVLESMSRPKIRLQINIKF